MRDMQFVLERWGVWSRSRPEMGYSAIAAGFKGLLPQEAGGQSCTDNDAMIIDACVGRLKQKLPNEHQLIEEHYIKGISKRMLARRHQTDEKRIRIMIMVAEGFVEGCLSMLDVSLEMDAYNQKIIINEPA